jgi:tRNA(Ile)-lysidine synthase
MEKYRKYCKNNKGEVIIYKDAFNEDEAILTRIIRNAFNELKGDLRNFERVHVYDIINIQRHSTGKIVMLPNNIEALNNYGDIHVYVRKNKKVGNKEEYNLIVDCENSINKIGLSISLKLIKNNIHKDLEKNNLIKYFDYDKMNGDIKLRYRRNGDKFTPLGMRGSKKLKDLFIDLKIPQNERESIPLICFGEEIAWVVGYRISNKFKIDEHTQNILQIKIEREE